LDIKNLFKAIFRKAHKVHFNKSILHYLCMAMVSLEFWEKYQAKIYIHAKYRNPDTFLEAYREQDTSIEA